MEEVIKIEGGHRLSGTVHISGSKNATVALIPAAVLAHGPVTICGVPNISDVRSLSVLLKELGVEVQKNRMTLLLSIRQKWKIVRWSVNQYQNYELRIISWELCLENMAV